MYSLAITVNHHCYVQKSQLPNLMHKKYLSLQIIIAACHLQTSAFFDTVNKTNASSYGPFLRQWHLQTAGEWQTQCGIKATAETRFFLHSLSSDCAKKEGKQNVQKTSVDPCEDAQIFQQSRSHINILGAVWVTGASSTIMTTHKYSATPLKIYWLRICEIPDPDQSSIRSVWQSNPASYSPHIRK